MSLKKILELKKYKNLYNWKSFEVILSFLASVILIIIINCLDFYDNFYNHKEFIVSLLSSSIFTFIGLIGFLLSAISITLSFLDKETIIEIEKLDTSKRTIDERGQDYSSIEYIVFDFIFLGLVISIIISIFVFIIFAVELNIKVLGKMSFNVTFFILSYLFFYIIFDSIALLYQCFSLFNIVKNIEKIIEKKNIIKDNLEKIERYYLEHIYVKPKTDERNINYNKIKDQYIFGLVLFINSNFNNSKEKPYYFKAITEKYSLNEDYINSIIMSQK